MDNLIMLSSKLRTHKSTKLKSTFLKFVKTLPPAYCRTRWNVQFYMLEHFLLNFDGYVNFSKNLSGVTEGYKYSCKKTDYHVANILYEVLAPFESITRLYSERKPLSICYIPSMCYLKERTVAFRNELSDHLNMPVTFPLFDAKYNKYFVKAMSCNYLLYACGLLHFQPDEVVECGNPFHVKKVDVLADLAFKLLKLKVKDSRSNVKDVNPPTFKFVFDKEEDYNQCSNDMGELLRMQYQTKTADLSLDQLCKKKYRGYCRKGIT